MNNNFIKKRNPIIVWLLLPIITFGIYHFVYIYNISQELNQVTTDNDLPKLQYLTLIAIFVPFGNCYSFYKIAQRINYLESYYNVEYNKCDASLACVLVFCFSFQVVYIQSHLNKLSSYFDTHKE